MLAISILFAIGGHSGSTNGLNLPGWVGFIILPLAVIGIWYAWRKKADNNDDDKQDE